MFVFSCTKFLNKIHKTLQVEVLFVAEYALNRLLAGLRPSPHRRSLQRSPNSCN